MDYEEFCKSAQTVCADDKRVQEAAAAVVAEMKMRNEIANDFICNASRKEKLQAELEAWKLYDDFEEDYEDYLSRFESEDGW